MERLKIVKLSPTENMTVLVETPVPRARHAEIAAELMACGGVNCEQVGYIEPAQDRAARARLQMMGGEFCGNAAMSLAALLCFREGMPDGTETDVPLEVSGAENTLFCHISRISECEYEGAVAMPRPLSIERRVLSCEGFSGAVICVRMDGITHLLLEASRLKEADPGVLLRRWAELFEEEAVGLVLCDFARNEIRPLVYVKPTGSAVWERGCGSGSAAYGAAAAWLTGKAVEIPVRQPGGVITVKADAERVEIRGRVKIVIQGEAWVSSALSESAE